MDGNGCLYGTLAGNTREILHKFSVDLPKKHGRGGQSALRFARLRLEKRQNYVRRSAFFPLFLFFFFFFFRCALALPCLARLARMLLCPSAVARRIVPGGSKPAAAAPGLGATAAGAAAARRARSQACAQC